MRGRGRGTVVLSCLAVGVLAAGAAGGSVRELTDAGPAVTKVAGVSAPNKLAGGLAETAVAQGSTPLENPAPEIGWYGYASDGPMLPAPGDVQTPTHNVEATKTEPDKNTYLVLHDQDGPTPGYDYGTHFLFQAHEAGPGYLTRVNLDASADHRVTLLAAADVNGAALPTIDGSTWDPFARRLLLTHEEGADGGVWQATASYPSRVEDISGFLGRGGYEGVQADPAGQIWLVEDVGGTTGTVNTKAKQPNSFVYRYVPRNPAALTDGGRLQVLQVISRRTHRPIVFHEGQADADILSPDVKDLHTYGLRFRTRWVTIHSTASDGTAPFDANGLAKAAGGTPFKRPENGVFRPGTDFRQFLFTETGDTNGDTQAGSQYGGFGGVFALRQSNPRDDDGWLQVFVVGDLQHTGFDNIQFWSRHQVAVVEDAGDTVHTQRNALDSGYLYDVHAQGEQRPLRFLAEGRDPSATIDSALEADADTNGFQNSGDGEITGVHVSNGDAGPGGLLGAQDPHPFEDGWRVFWTQQHGDNVTYELIER